MDRLKLYELANDDNLLGELSKKQKDILSAFKLRKNVKPSKNFG